MGDPSSHVCARSVGLLWAGGTRVLYLQPATLDRLGLRLARRAGARKFLLSGILGVRGVGRLLVAANRLLCEPPCKNRALLRFPSRP